MSSNQRNRYNAADTQTPDCQDWTPVTLSKSKPTSTAGSYKDAAATATAATATKNSASAVVAAITAKSSTDTGTDDNAKKTKYVAKATSDAIRNARCEKKLTQKELAQKCNMDASIVSEIERGGTCVYNATHVNKIQSVLGVKIPRA
jgi:ribosome-binding protein aMBF1 (putative translation factor)